MNAHCLVRPIRGSRSELADWTPGCSLATQTYLHSIFFFQCSRGSAWKDTRRHDVCPTTTKSYFVLPLNMIRGASCVGEFGTTSVWAVFYGGTNVTPAAAADADADAAAAAVARQHTVFHSSSLLGRRAEVSFSSHFISPYICLRTTVVQWLSCMRSCLTNVLLTVFLLLQYVVAHFCQRKSFIYQRLPCVRTHNLFQG